MSLAIIETDIREQILTIRGMQVMLDRDLAALYGVSTKALNQAVKRNAERFPDRFMFRLTDSEMNELVTNCDRFKRLKHSSVTMCAFTEQGIAMLSAVLRSDVAVQASLRIMDAFVAMRRALVTMAPMLTRLEAIERRQITDQSRNEARFDEIFAKMSEGELPEHQIFYQGKFWDAKSLLIKFIRRAKKELMVIDAYPGVATLDILAKAQRGVKIELVTHSSGELA